MSAEKKAVELGLEFATVEPGYLNLCIRTGNLLITSGHTSDQKGVLGKDVTVERATPPPRTARSRSSAPCARLTARSTDCA